MLRDVSYMRNELNGAGDYMLLGIRECWLPVLGKW